MAPYTYTKLKIEDEEIRLVRLMPKAFAESLALEIFHVPLITPRSEQNIPDKRLSIADLQKTLPHPWTVQETLHGRYLFMMRGKTGQPNSWDHPDPSIDRSLYDLDDSITSPDFLPRYEALSYTWGSSVAQVKAYIVNASDPWSPHNTIYINSNLSHALNHLRYPEEQRTLWVDALCIDQHNIEERNIQVKRMGNIYSLAKRVVVWIGEEWEDSQLALATLKDLGDQVEHTVKPNFGDAPGAREIRWWDPVYSLPYDDRTWSSLLSLCLRPWFSRVWVLQEIHLANHGAIVQCGTDTCPWITIRKALLSLRDKMKLPPELRAVLESYAIGLEDKRFLGFDKLLQLSRSRCCLDPRDKIYGVLSLVSSSISTKIRPQYSLPVANTYAEAFLTHLDITRRLDLITHCRIEQSVTGGASWIPNWSVEPASFLGTNRFGHIRLASGLSAAKTRYLDPKTLEVCGVQCARINTVAKFTSADTKNEIFEAVRHLELENSSASNYPTGCTFRKAAFEVMFRGRTVENYLAKHATSHFQSIVEIQREFLDTAPSLSSKADASNRITTLRADKASIITTDEGYLGAGPAGIKPGLSSLRNHHT